MRSAATSTNAIPENGATFVQNVSQKSNPAVTKWRYGVLAVLGVSTIAASIVVYQYTSHQQYTKFVLDSSNDGTKVLESIGRSLDFTFNSIDNTVTSIVSFTHFTKQEWPFVIIPDFALRLSKLRSVTNAVASFMYPFVADSQREQWENFTAQPSNNYWVNECIEIQATDPTFEGDLNLISINNYTAFNVIHGYDEYVKPLEEIGTIGTNRSFPPYYLPMWQNAPIVTALPPYNWDLLSVYQKTDAINFGVQSSKVFLSEAYLIPDYSDPIKQYEVEQNAEWYRPYLGPDENPMEPVSEIYYPIINQVKSIISSIPSDTSSSNTTFQYYNSSYNNGQNDISINSADTDELILQRIRNNKFVGYLTVPFYWRHMLKAILPMNTVNNIILNIVFVNPCNPTFTYQVNGPKATFMGIGDHHDRKFDSIALSTVLLDINSYLQYKSLYTGVPVASDYCPFTIHVYPDLRMEKYYLTSRPIYMTIGVIVIFGFTSTVFLIYNYWVERRQNQIFQCALQSSINASELDRIVQDRTVSLRQTNEQLELANERIQKASALQLEHFACMSHEIRTPLNCISGLSSVVSDDLKCLSVSNMNTASTRIYDTNDKRDKNVIASTIESMQLIISSSELLRTIVDDVLDFAKLGSGKVELDVKDDVDLQTLLNTVVASIELYDAVLTNTISIKTRYGLMLNQYLTTDSRRLQQILYNLLGNAVKFSHSNQMIELHVDCYEQQHLRQKQDTTYMAIDCDTFLKDGNKECTYNPDVPVATSLSCPFIRFKVRDYGSGIPRENFQAIFEPFIQARGAITASNHSGTGLGLAITARLVRALGGYISVDSEVNKWTEFQVDIPIDRNQQPYSPSPSCDSHTIAGDISYLYNNVRCIFVVDDNIDDRQHIVNVFQGFKVKCLTFNNLIELQKHRMIDQTKPLLCDKSMKIVVLVCDDLDDPVLTTRLVSESTNLKLISFGPKNGMANASLGKFLSLTRILPVVLIKSIADYIRSAEIVPKINVSRSEVVPNSTGEDGITGQMQSIKSPSPNGVACNHDVICNQLDISTLKVLVAEDNKINQKVLLRILNRLNVTQVILVENGQEAVERELVELFDVILMDMQMPILDGIGACKQIVARADGEGEASNPVGHPVPKIIFLTAHVSDAFEKECYDAGAVGFISKPCNIDRIADALRKSQTRTIQFKHEITGCVLPGS